VQAGSIVVGGQEIAAGELGESEHSVIFRSSGVVAVLVVHDGRIWADEVELVDAGFHIESGCAVGGERKHVVKRPERRAEGVADAWLTSAGVGVGFDDAVGNSSLA